MMNESEVKQVKAKLYNLKSGIDGMIAMVDAGTLAMNSVIDSVGALGTKCMEDLKRQADKDSLPV